ncbi:MAG: hypothetical protein ACKOPM_08060, partial [Novosphingobium sp.]
MALNWGKTGVSLAALIAVSLAAAPGSELRLGPAQGPQLVLPLSAVSLAEAATKKKVAAKKKAPAKRPNAARRVCTTKKVKGKLVRTCRTVAARPAAVASQPPVVVITRAAEPAPIPLPIAAPPAPVPVPPLQPARPPYVDPPASAFVWIDMADTLADAIGDAPPDYTFRVNGNDCWAWQTRTGEMLIVEARRDGIVQYFYERGGRWPYLVREDGLSYAFDDNQLVQIYDERGRLYTGVLIWDQNQNGQRLWARGGQQFAALNPQPLAVLLLLPAQGPGVETAPLVIDLDQLVVVKGIADAVFANQIWPAPTALIEVLDDPVAPRLDDQHLASA